MRRKTAETNALGAVTIYNYCSCGALESIVDAATNTTQFFYDNQGNLYVSSFDKGEVYKISRMGRGPMEIFMGGLITPADISCDRQKDELLIPSFKGNSVSTVPLRKSK